MIRHKWFNALALSASLSVGGIAVAQTDEEGPIVFVTAASPVSGATRGVSGPPFPTLRGSFTDEDNGVLVDQSVVTLDDATASLMLPAHGTVVRLGPGSELVVGNWNNREIDVPVTLTLLKGQAYILRRNTDGWLALAVRSGVDSGYALSKSRAMVLTSGDAGVGIDVLEGVATWFDGPIPGAALIDESGEPVERTGVLVREGQHISQTGVTEPIPEGLSQRIAADTGRGLFAFGVAQGAQWIEDAERGDFTPVRAAARGTAQFFRAKFATELAFDQARSVVAAPSPRAVTRPVRTATQNPVRALLESGLPTNVIVGQRLRRTRIIGSPGTAGSQIRANPNAEQLIRLSGTSR